MRGVDAISVKDSLGKQEYSRQREQQVQNPGSKVPSLLEAQARSPLSKLGERGKGVRAEAGGGEVFGRTQFFTLSEVSYGRVLGRGKGI